MTRVLVAVDEQYNVGISPFFCARIATYSVKSSLVTDPTIVLTFVGLNVDCSFYNDVRIL
jgi:hypothetical protein